MGSLEDTIRSLERKLGLEPGLPFRDLEDLLVSKNGFGLETATPCQRAICRIIDGKPLAELTADKTVRKLLALNGISPGFTAKPKRIVLLAGIRTFKSLLGAAVALHASQTCDLGMLTSSEVPRYPIVSLKMDLAHVIFRHLVGALLSSSTLRTFVVGEPTADSIMLRHPSGRDCEVKIAAGARAGSSLVARWLFGVSFDEAARMVGASEGVVNLDDQRDAVQGRLLPGAQSLEISSPWAPVGPVYDAVTEYIGRPSRDLVVIKAKAHWLNPYWWTEERREELKRTNPTAYQTDVEAEFADVEETMFPDAILSASTRERPKELPFVEGHDYVAAMDPATRGNAWTLIVCDRVGAKKRVVIAKQWQGSPVDPLSPRQVVADVSKYLARYGLHWAYTDQWAGDALRDIASEKGLALVIEDWTAKTRTEAFQSLAVALADGQVELAPEPQLLKDLRLTKRRTTQVGTSIVLPKTSDGRHCDYSPALARALAHWLDEEREVEPERESQEWFAWQEQKQIEAEEAELENKGREWWAQ